MIGDERLCDGMVKVMEVRAVRHSGGGDVGCDEAERAERRCRSQGRRNA